MLREISISLVIVLFLSGCIDSEPQSEDGYINKYLCFIGSSLSDTTYQQFIADHFDTVGCGSSASVVAKAGIIKSINPGVSFYGYFSTIDCWDYYTYYPEVNLHEDWFFHDKYGDTSDHRIYSPSGNSKCYLMDPSSGWADYFAGLCLTFLEGNSTFTSIHADNALTDWEAGLYGSQTTPFIDWDPIVLGRWHNGMVSLLSKTREKITIPFMTNCWKSTDSSNASGIHMWEHFIHGPAHDLYEPGNGASWQHGLYSVNLLRNQVKNGVKVCVISGTDGYPSEPTQEDKDRLHQLQVFTLCSFLFVVEKTEESYYTWMTNTYGGDPALSYFSELDYNFGQPKGEYYQILDYLYCREFTRSTIFVNFSPTNTYSVIFNNVNYSLSPRSGLPFLVS